MHRVRVIRREAAEIVSTMLTRIELVSRMRRDVDEVKLLADRHILANDATAMAAIEQQRAAVEADYDAAAARYDVLPASPDETARWHAFHLKVAALRPALDSMLDLSRKNEDIQARRALGALEADFGAIARDSLALTEMSHAGSDSDVLRVVALQRSATALLQVLALAGIALSLTVGLGVTRLAQRREALQARYSEVLEANNRELDAFAGRVAHDLREPLTTASLAIYRLVQQSPQPAKSADVLQRSLARMEVLIEDLLALSRMQSAAPESACDPASAARQLREDFAARTEKEHVSLMVDVQPARVRGTEGLLRQAMWNLVDNAMKYRRADPPCVEVRGRLLEGRYELSVHDNGVGMTPEEASRAFDPFYRGMRQEDAPGVGLGLSIVKRVVEACGGSVSVDSRPGSGSVFVLQLPLA
jgi:signal transduction histidine kinase